MHKAGRLLYVPQILSWQHLYLFADGEGEQYGIMKPIKKEAYVLPCQMGRQ
jgi:hypothetical protein